MKQVLLVPLHPADVVKDIRRKEIERATVVIINMPLRESARPNTTPEGPLLLATNLRETWGVNASVIDLNAYRIQDDTARARGLPWGRHLTEQEAHELISRHFDREGNPLLIGLSGKITTLAWQERIAKIVRRLTPETFLVSGGGLATELHGQLFSYIPELDGVAHSEGDDIIVKIVFDAVTIKKNGFVRACAEGKLRPYHIGAINGRERFVYAGNRPRNLDILPSADLELLREDALGNPVLDWYLKVPAWSMASNNSSAAPWNDEDVVPKTTSVSSRGCPFACNYCFRKTQGERQWGVRSGYHVMRELERNIDRYGIKFHGFPDDNFAVNLARIEELRNIVPWGTHTRLDEVAGLNDTTRGTAEVMARAGCVYIGFGPESASPRVLETIGKGGHTLTNGFEEVVIHGARHQFPRSMIAGIMNAARVGIHGNCTWIMGSPSETLDDLKESVRFMAWQREFYGEFGIRPESVNTRMFTMTWYPGVTLINQSKVRAELTRTFGLTFQETDPQNRKKGGVEWEPVADAHFYAYLLSLDDATKVLVNKGEPLNFSNLPTDTFLKARELVDTGHTFEILDM